MGTKKTTTKKSPTGAPLGNPLKFFREGGEKRKAMFKHGGYNVPNNSLPRKDNGGPGSGMGRMAADDAAFDALMNQPSTPTMRELIGNSNSTKMGPYGNTTPGQIYKKPSYREYGNQNTTPPDTVRMKDLNIGDFSPAPRGGKGFGNTTPGEITTPLIRKKGGSVKRKK